jgi:hypothetical protein
MYIAEGDKIYIVQEGKRELFLTVHPTDTGGTSSVEEQARILAKVLNAF